MLTAEEQTAIEQIMAETRDMSDRDMLIQIYARVRFLDAMIEKMKQNPMLSAMLG